MLTKSQVKQGYISRVAESPINQAPVLPGLSEDDFPGLMKIFPVEHTNTHVTILKFERVVTHEKALYGLFREEMPYPTGGGHLLGQWSRLLTEKEIAQVTQLAQRNNLLSVAYRRRREHLLELEQKRLLMEADWRRHCIAVFDLLPENLLLAEGFTHYYNGDRESCETRRVEFVTAIVTDGNVKRVYRHADNGDYADDLIKRLEQAKELWRGHIDISLERHADGTVEAYFTIPKPPE